MEPLPYRPYPEKHRHRDEWILARRPHREAVSPWLANGCFLELERTAAGSVVQSATILLTNRECPLRCLMCDLWKGTLAERVPVGAIPAQIKNALSELQPRLGPDQPLRQLKLYNAGSFFDPKAIPPEDYEAIAELSAPFERIIVECHPAFLGDRSLQFQELLARANARQFGSRKPAPALEVAIGLESAHPEVLARLNKQMSLQQFSRAARFLDQHQIALRVFVLVQPPFLTDAAESIDWAERSMSFAFEAKATVVCAIPTRAGNGALDALQSEGLFNPPTLATIEAAQARGLTLRQGRVFTDLWELRRFSACGHCFEERYGRLQRMNLEQEWIARPACAHCTGA